MRWSLGVVLAATACGFPKLPSLGDSTGDGSVDAPPDDRTVVARVPVAVNRDLDLLFVIDDSPSMLDKQANLKAAFPSFINELSLVEGGLPNVHIGVVTSDLGSKGADDATAGPGIGSGPGSCMGNGKNGNLVTNGTPLVQGLFISDTKNTDGTRTQNYTGQLTDAFSAIASVGAGGCGFEQPLQAIKLALSGNPNNAGFLRQNASLAVLVLSDEDDCSMSHSSLMSSDTTTLGPLQSFRCTRFGVTCAVGGTTSDEMNVVGSKSGCQSNESSPYLTKVNDYVTFLKSLKSDPANLLFAAMVAPETPVDVELRTPPGGGTAINALAHSCMYTGANGTEVGDPAVRITQVAHSFLRNATTSVCAQDLSTRLLDIAREVRGLAGDTCLTQDIALPADCIVRDVAGASTTVIPECGGAATSDCYRLIADPAKCTTASHLRIDVVRGSPPPPNNFVVASCKL